MSANRKFWKENSLSPREFHQLVGDLKIGDYTPAEINEILQHEYYTQQVIYDPSLKKHTVYESDIDNREIKCGCQNPKCRIGFSFDTDPDIMRLQDKYGNEHAFVLTKETINQIIDHLQEIEA